MTGTRFLAETKDDPTPNPISGARHSRRDLLRWAAMAAGAVGASELLAACGGGGACSGGQQAAPGSLRRYDLKLWTGTLHENATYPPA
jgi:hypothetical protein